MKELISKNAPAAIGPYSQAIRVGKLIFTSGQLPINPKTNRFISQDIKEQTQQSLENIKNILKEENVSVNSIVKIKIFLSDMEDYKEVNEVYGRFFKHPYPARSAIQVARLPMDAKIEIEAIAEILED